MRGVIAVGNPRVAEAAAGLLRSGGNAIDAACAAAFATFAAEPLLASAGGAGLATVALRGQAPLAVDFFSRVPGMDAARPEEAHFEGVEIDFKSTIQTFHVGRGSVAAPLALPGLALLVERFGVRPLADVVAPAIDMCRRGVPLSPVGARIFQMLWPIMERDRETVRLYSDDDGPPPRGRLMKNPELGDILAEYAKTGAMPRRAQLALLDAFGPSRGGLLTEADLAVAKVDVVAPATTRVGAYQVYTSPHIGGRLVKRILESLTDTVMETEVEEMTQFAAASRAAHFARVGVTTPGNTTHISVLDGEQNAAAITLTNGEGSGHLIPGTGIQTNNFLGEEDLNPQGFHLHAAGARLPTMVAPTLAFRDGEAVLALGSGGANRIRSSVSQVLYRIAHDHASLETAVMAPRVHAETDDAWFEREGLDDPDAVIAALGRDFARVSPFPTRNLFFGGVHAVLKGEDGTYTAFGDPRRGGAAILVDDSE
jgi:gamma-glutamyltranspeptidase/glutathione hydrolase